MLSSFVDVHQSHRDHQHFFLSKPSPPIPVALVPEPLRHAANPFISMEVDQLDYYECPGCPSPDIIEDLHDGTIVCTNCGLVLSETVFDLSEEYRTFDDDAGTDRTRVSRRANPLLESDTHTGIGGLHSTLRKTHLRNGLSKTDKTLTELFPTITELCERLRLPGTAQSRAFEFIQKYVYEIADGRQRRVLSRDEEHRAAAAAAVVHGFRVMKTGRTIGEVARFASSTPHAIGNAVRDMQEKLGIKSQEQEELHVPRFATALGLDSASCKDMEAVVRALKDGPLFGRTAPTVVAVGLYVMLHLSRRKVDREKIADVCRVAPSSILKRYRDLHAGLPALLEKAVPEFRSKYRGKLPNVRERKSSVSVAGKRVTPMKARGEQRQGASPARKQSISDAEPVVAVQLFPMAALAPPSGAESVALGGKRRRMNADPATLGDSATSAKGVVVENDLQALPPVQKRKRKPVTSGSTSAVGMDLAQGGSQTLSSSAKRKAARLETAVNTESIPVVTEQAPLDDRYGVQMLRQHSVPDAKSTVCPEAIRGVQLDAPLDGGQDMPVVRDDPQDLLSVARQKRRRSEADASKASTPEVLRQAPVDRQQEMPAMEDTAPTEVKSALATDLYNTHGVLHDMPCSPKRKSASLESVMDSEAMPVGLREDPLGDGQGVQLTVAQSTPPDVRPVCERKRAVHETSSKPDVCATRMPKASEDDQESGLPASKRSRRSPKSTVLKTVSQQDVSDDGSQGVPAASKGGKGRKTTSKANTRVPAKPMPATRTNASQDGVQGVRRSARVRKRKEVEAEAKTTSKAATKQGRKKRGRK